MPRPNRTLDELKEASNHLFYEISMLKSTAQGIATGVAGNSTIGNALLESFVIHVRAVMDFLYSDKPRPDDVIAEDFFDNPDEWTNTRPELSAVLSEAKRRAGKEVTHLTYGRLAVTPETKPWRFLDIGSEISVVIGIFLKRVSKTKLGVIWKTNRT